MPAAKLPLAIEQGSTWRHSLLLYAGKPTVDPLLDLNGYSARMQLRAEVDNPTVLIELSSSNGRIQITPAAGRLDLLISSADTADLNFSRAVYDLEITSADGEATRILEGIVTLSREVTR